MGKLLKKRAKRHGLWPDSFAFRGRGFRKARAEARRIARKQVSKAKRGKPWQRRYTRRVVTGEGGDEKVFWDRGPK